MNITVYTKDNCAYCVAAKMFLEEKGIKYTEKKMNKDFSREQLLEMFPYAKTMPMIFDEDNFIGGFESLPKYVENNYKLLEG